MRRLLSLGLSPQLCHEIAADAGQAQDLDGAWNGALASLLGRIRCTDDEILTCGGVIALVGATGVGKTTTVAKLAAQYILRHGPGTVGLVTTDGYRIGTQEQLRAFGRILDIPVAYAANRADLATELERLSDRSLVLIDTQGIGQRDARLMDHLSLLGGEGSDGLRCHVVLAANTQPDGLQEVIAAFRRITLHGAIVTKVDEAVSLGGVISTLLTHDLPLGYIADGQQVPDDLKPGNPRELVRTSLSQPARELAPADHEAHALTLGPMVAGLHA
jgi:flagellar biosynthesis protein FlhF